MVILGLGGLLSDAACALLKVGVIVAAVEQSKLIRGARPGEIPQAAIDECLRIARLTRDQVDCVALVRPFATGPEAQMHLALRGQFPKAEIVVLEHHLGHAAAAYYASPFDRATVLTLDHAGDFRCGTLWSAEGTTLALTREWHYPDSLGRLYGAVTELLGFHARADEHKVQWLSTFGDERFVPLFREIVSVASKSEAKIDESFFDAARTSRGGFSAKMFEKLGIPDGAPLAEKTLAAAVARGLQAVVEETVIALAGSGENLCLGGGLFLNALLVAALERCGNWRNVFVQGAAGNAGSAIGAAYQAWHAKSGQARLAEAASTLLLGPSYEQEEIKRVLENCKLSFRYLRSSDEMLATAVKFLGEHKIIAWMQGRMEFGSRALGNRSILASPLDPYSTENLNVFIKHREPFRKFAASVPAELAAEYFEAGPNARNLATVGRVKAAHRKTFASAILGEDMVRVHTVTEQENPLYHRLLHEAGRVTGLPVLYNTSFNLFGDPLVSTPRDAVRSFYSSGIDALFAGHFVVTK
jgi:carbamoyltransferase